MMNELRISWYPVLVALTLLMGKTASAQIQTEAQCRATLNARASLSLTQKKLESICSQYPMEIVNCALTESQSNRLTGDLQNALKRCQLEYSVLTAY